MGPTRRSVKDVYSIVSSTSDSMVTGRPMERIHQVSTDVQPIVTVTPQTDLWPIAEGPTPALQPWLHELEICADGHVTALSRRDGSMGGGATGFYVDDRRVLSVLDVQLGEAPAAFVTASSAGATSQFWCSARQLGILTPDPTIEVRRTRTLTEGDLVETIEIANRTESPLESRLFVRLAGDGLTMAQVKGGDPAGALLPAELLSERGDIGWQDQAHRTVVSVDPAPTAVEVGSDCASTVLAFDTSTAAGEPTRITVRVTATRLAGGHFDADSGSGTHPWARVAVRADDARLDATIATSLIDLRHLLNRDPAAPDDIFAAAGSPWYLTLFGRDSLWAARLMLPFGTDLAAGTLRTLARRQGTQDDPQTAEQPGKILHEVRKDATSARDAHMIIHPVYYGTVDATALWILLLHDAWRHGLPQDQVRELLPNLRAALGWVRSAAQAGDDGLLRYVDETGTGLANQGWKDSGDSMRDRSGQIAPAPIALLEAQTYAVEAARKAADLLDALGETDGDPWRSFADDLTGRIRERFWVDATTPYPAMAIDGEGRQVDGVGSNMGHGLGSGAFTAAEVEQVVATLTDPAMLGDFGIGTLSRDNPAYNPIGYHTGSVWTHDTAICALGMVAEGHSQAAAPVLRALVGAADAFDYRWPELYSGDPVRDRPAPYPASCRPQAWSAASAGAIITALLGLGVDVPGSRVTLSPMRPSPFGAVQVSGLRYGDAAFAVELTAAGEATVTGLPQGVSVEVDTVER